MSCGIRKVPIGALSPDINNALIIGVIIAKQNLKIFMSKKDSEERGVWNFTLRDSATDTINGTIWGSSSFTQYTYQTFNIGDIVEIISPRILFKQSGSADALFGPIVTSPFQLHLQENSSDLLLYSEEDVELIRELIRIPTKSVGDFLKLSDVLSYGQAMKGKFVNLLVAVRNVGGVRNVTSKRECKDLICRHVTVMDQSCLEFHITLWNEEIIKRSDFWRSRQTVIFFSDIRVEWDQFRSEITANITSRTVVTENPKTPEAIALEKYAKTAPIHPTAVLDHFANNIRSASNVQVVMTTAQVLDKAFSGKNPGDQFTALVYAVVTHLNLDGSETVYTYKCAICFQILDETESCLNRECLTNPKPGCSEVSFNLKINLTDHRGTLYNCRLVSPSADEILGCSVKKFIKMSHEEKTKLKWRLLLTRCEAHVLVLTPSPERPRPLISLLTCSPAKPSDVACKLPIY